MKFELALLTTLAIAATTPSAALAQEFPNYVGVGIRAGFNDNTSFVVDSKATITELGGDAALSVRPAVVFDDSTKLRLPVSVDFAIEDTFYPYAGAGVAYNADGSSRIDPMITGGVDWSVARNIVLDLNASVLFKPSDTDTEVTATINYAF
jgi:hypothetical protein